MAQEGLKKCFFAPRTARRVVTRRQGARKFVTILSAPALKGLHFIF